MAQLLEFLSVVGRYVPEILLVVIFMVYEERQQIRLSRMETERQAKFQEQETARQKQRQEMEAKRDEVWRGFLDDERALRTKDSDAIVQLLERNTALVSQTLDTARATRETLVIHDAWERQVQAKG